jgi:DmsE family decaheme c-type cytochrome
MADSKVRLPLILGGILLATLIVLSWPNASAQVGDAQWADSDACADCHADISENFSNTRHGTHLSGRAMPEMGSCQACHGPGEKHIESGEAADILNPAKLDMVSGESTCLGCHDDYLFEGWAASIHRNNGIECTDCHKVHISFNSKDYYKRQIDQCYECHSEVKAATYMPSRHPIAEGKIECNDCHQIHGGENPFMQNFTSRELCLGCHAQLEGPFIFEHAPVTEDCMICHVPHGSVANSLLKQAEPSLCLGCHSMHFHAGIEGVDGPFSVPNAPERSGVSNPEGWKQAMLTKCTQCHSEIHGSDHPSQSISGQGRSMTR